MPAVLDPAVALLARAGRGLGAVGTEFNGSRHDVWPSPCALKPWMYILSYMAFELVLMKVVAGKQFKATVTATGHVPEYKANGVQCYVIISLAFCACGLQLHEP